MYSLPLSSPDKVQHKFTPYKTPQNLHFAIEDPICIPHTDSQPHFKAILSFSPSSEQQQFFFPFLLSHKAQLFWKARQLRASSASPQCSTISPK